MSDTKQDLTKAELLVLMDLQKVLVNLFLENLLPISKLKVEREFCNIYIKEIMNCEFIDNTDESIKRIADFLEKNEAKFSEKFRETRKSLFPKVAEIIVDFVAKNVNT